MQYQSNIQKQTQTQTIKILPQQIQFLNLLHLNVMELENYIRKEIEENPFLEINSETELGPAEADLPVENDGFEDDNFDNPLEYRGLDDEMPDYNTKIENGYDTGDIYQAPAVQTTDIREDLKSQCAFLPVDERMRVLCAYLIDSLDDTGFLTVPLEDLSDDISFSKNTFYSDEEMNEALHIVQQFDPSGLGARSLKECLLIQLRRRQAEGYRVDLPITLVNEYMEALAAHDYTTIKNELHVDDEDLRYAVEYIRNLNPRPLRGVADPAGLQNGTIAPEYIVEVDGKDIFITLANGRAETLKLSDDLGDMLKNTRDKKAEQFIRKKMEDAQWIIEALRQRDDTMLRVMQVVGVLQRPFFLTGDFHELKPMILRDVADYVGLDISTISRVTSSKYVQTPFGIYNLKNLFTHTFTATDGRELNNQDVQDCLEDIIKNESKSEPLNDTEICKLLTERGYPVARRTVAKYRDLLQIPVAALRRVI